MASLTHSIAVFDDGGIEVEGSASPLVIQKTFHTPPASVGRLLMGQHDFRTYEANKWQPRQAAWKTDVPETIHLMPPDKREFLPLTEELQWYYLRTMMIANPLLTEAEAIKIMLELTRTSVCFTDDGNSWDAGRRFDIAGKNLSNPVPIAWKISIACAGNPFLRKYGTTVHAIDPEHLPADPAEHYKQEPWKYFWAEQASWRTIPNAYEWRGGKKRPIYECPPFPQMGPVGTLVPLMGAGGETRFLEDWRAVEVPNDAEYSPYVLPAGWIWF